MPDSQLTHQIQEFSIGDLNHFLVNGIPQNDKTVVLVKIQSVGFNVK